MTTIAFDGEFLSADSLVSEDGTFCGYVEKIHFVRGGILAAAGGLEDVSLAVDWFNKDCPEGNKPSLESFQAIFIPDRGEPVEYGARLAPMPALIPWVSGSGRNFALAALKLGKTTEEAVHIAIGLDLFSGGDVMTVKVRC